MPIVTSHLASDLSAMIGDMPVAAQFAAVTFNCSATELSHEETLVLTGNITGRMVRIVCSAQLGFGATFKPQARLLLKFPNPAAFSNYEIVTISLAPDFVSYEIVLKQDNRA